MKVYSEINLRRFDAWAGAIETKEVIIEKGKAEDFDSLIKELYPEGLSDTQLNDILWFEEDWLFENLGIATDEK